jgi:RimJ/RimL family protein N-acetyltransferase
MCKVNYVISTWAGNRRAPNSKYLKNHLLKLLSLDHNLSQITIVNPVFNRSENPYYDIDELISQFDCKVVVLDRNSNNGQSYGQLFYAYETFKDEFDYYIFAEDDYVADIDNFDKILVDEYVDQEVDGYLCSFAGVAAGFPRGGCSVSNGIMSSEYFEKVYSKFTEPTIFLHNSDGNECHKNFAILLRECGFEFKDFASKYRVPYYGTSIVEYGRTDTNESVFVPHQLFNVELSFSLMTLEDLPLFLDIRNNSKDFLHNNNEFTLTECTQWFVESSPEFYMIKMGSKSIGYFRTSKLNKNNQSVYIGCDIHTAYRGYSLGYKSYLGFIEMIQKKHNLTSIDLEVLSTNDRAIGLYKKLGFKTTNIETGSITRGDKEFDNVFMKLEL